MSIFNSLIKILKSQLFIRKHKIDFDLSSVDEKPSDILYPPVFVVGTGRNGTHFMAKTMEKSPSIFSIHLDSINHSYTDSLIPYIVWNNLNIDLLPFREYRRKLIQYCANRNQIYFECNPYLSLVADNLIKWFGAYIILLVRNPIDVVNSHYTKGWYKKIPPRSNFSFAPGFWPELSANQVFGRLMPNGEEFTNWIKMTRIGKIAWWWKTLNSETLNRLEKMPSEQYRVIRLESFDYKEYCNLCYSFNTKTYLSQNEFNRLRSKPPGKGPSKMKAGFWTEKEQEEFLEQTSFISKRLGYSDSKV